MSRLSAILAGDSHAVAAAITDGTGEVVIKKWLGEGNTPLNILVGHGATIDDLSGCLSEGADPCQSTAGGWTAVHTAAFHERVDFLRLLVMRRVNMRLQAGENGMMPLHAAVLGRAMNAIVFLLEAGISVNTPDAKGETPLDYADRQGRVFGNTQMARFLEQKGGVRKTAL